MSTVHASWNPLKRYTRWLHTMWPAGVVEKLPEVNADGSTRIDGVYIVGDLTGIPLLKFSSDTGARAVQTILKDPAFRRTESNDALDLVIIGAGVSGMAAALEAKKNNLKFQVLEASEAFSTIVNFPRAKPIYTYPTEMTPAGDLQFHAQVKEPLVEELRAQTRGIEPRPARCERVVRTGDRQAAEPRPHRSQSHRGSMSGRAATTGWEGRPGVWRRASFLNADGDDGGHRSSGTPSEAVDIDASHEIVSEPRAERSEVLVH